MFEKFSEIMLTCTPNSVNANGAPTSVFIHMREEEFRG